MNIQTEDRHLWKAKCVGSTTHRRSVGRAVLCTPYITIRGAHGVTRPTEGNLSAPELSPSANERAMPAFFERIAQEIVRDGIEELARQARGCHAIGGHKGDAIIGVPILQLPPPFLGRHVLLARLLRPAYA